MEKFSFRSKKCQRRQVEKVSTMTERQSINQQEESVQLVTGCSGKHILNGLVIMEHRTCSGLILQLLFFGHLFSFISFFPSSLVLVTSLSD